MEEKGINSRIIQIMNDESLSKNAFGKQLGVTQTAISRIELNKNFPSFKLIVELLKRYPNINPDWLLLGIGPKKRSAYGENRQQPSMVNDIATPYFTGDQEIVNKALEAVDLKSEETVKLIDVVKGQMDEMIRYGARLDRILILLDKLYGVKFIEPETQITI